jgi:hypothetical protein
MTACIPNPTSPIRAELGDFSSIVCFKAVVVGVEEALGEKAAAIAMISAGRARGRDLIKALGISHKDVPFSELTTLLQKTLGKDGTRLCLVDKIEQQDDNILVYCRETVCSAGEPDQSPRCLTYTLGALQGALEELTGQRLRGKQIASVLRGGTHDVVEFAPLG